MSADAGKPKDDLIGKSLGQYEIIEEIGRGGMATVYRARQKSMNRIVAVKVLPRHLMHDPGFFERFGREVDVISHLEHPHILPIYDYGQVEGIPYIIMRFLGGGSLEQFIRRGQRALDDMEKPLRQIAQALDYAHQQGIIHRDIKPGNIMLDENGNAYLSDFGIARVLGSEMTGSMIIGTPAYMSPEQANGMPIDSRSDIYALGVVLFELITGREPYHAETPMAVLLKHINESIPPITQFRDDIPETVEDVIVKATAKDPTQRFASAGDMAKAFSAAIRGEPATFEPPTRAGAATKRTPTPPPIPAFAGTPATDPTLERPATLPAPPEKKRSPLPLILGLLVVIGLIAGGVVVAPQLLNPPPPTPAVNISAVPTPFFRASTVEYDLYTISIPQSWIPTEGVTFTDLSDTTRLVHRWEDANQDAYIALIMINIGLIGSGEFENLVADYTRRYFDSDETLALIDEGVADDGTIRRSYWTRDSDTAPLPKGQLDVYFLQRGDYLVVLEMYGADRMGNTLIPTFQSIFDSLRIKANAS